MANKMLIDATHPEETRVVVLRGSRVEEFDFESASKRQLRGNIYLAKVIRVEPSLQAAFVDYGGNRHGFLAFSEIHPDYYQIPVSDRQALLEEETHEEQDEEDERRPRRSRRRRGGERHAAAEHRNGDEVVREPADIDGSATSGEDRPGVDVPHQEGSVPTPDGDHEARPVHLDASDTPPYDDPTPDLLRHASEVHDHGVNDNAIADAGHRDISPAATEVAVAQAVAEPEQQVTATSVDVPFLAEAAEDAPPTADVEAREPDDTPVQTDAAVDTGATGYPDETPDEGSSNDNDPASHEHNHDHRRDSRHDHHDDGDDHEEEHVDQLGGDAMEEVPRPTYRPRRQYKIQEVIKRRQVLLVQVVKEERGNKGAALTTYLSLAGRYSVLMPNTAKGGGISRKITDAGDRQRLKTIAQDLEVPDGMGVILRTAGASRTKPEVKRDFEYLMRMWETVRETTLASTAPKLVYEEGSLIKRAIRDLYNKDVEEIVVAGENGYREAKEFMRLLMPSHGKNVQPWRDPAPLFTKAGAEAQLDAMFSNQVTLKSGGSLVINQTEALVAIDVNSGRSTREHNIEDTALRTNLEAADEVARQLRLRDLAGLIVVDFIDMEEGRNNRAVEKRLKDALKDDRARIQIGRISHFGLLEMSRQRIRTGVLEGSTEVCQHCAGAGMVRSTASIALHVLRVLEDALLSDASRNITVRTRGAVALYILNNKRAHLADLETRFGVATTFESDEQLTGMTYCGLERGEPATGPVQSIRPTYQEEPDVDLVADLPDEEESETTELTGASVEETSETPRRRRRRRGRGRDRVSSGIAEDAPQPPDDALRFITDVEGARVAESDRDDTAEPGEGVEPGAVEAVDDLPPREEGRGRRRRSRRGGRRGREMPELEADRRAELGPDASGAAVDPAFGAASEPSLDGLSAPFASPPIHADEPGAQLVARQPEHEPSLAPLAAPIAPPAEVALPVHTALPVETASPFDPVPQQPAHAPPPAAHEGAPAEEPAPTAPGRPEPVSSELDPSRPKRSGWWQRAKASLGG